MPGENDTAGEGTAGQNPAAEKPVRELEAQFPGWHVWPSNAGRWWATRTGPVTGRDSFGAGRVMTVDADDIETLRAQLGRQSRLDQAAQQ